MRGPADLTDGAISDVGPPTGSLLVAALMARESSGRCYNAVVDVLLGRKSVGYSFTEQAVSELMSWGHSRRDFVKALREWLPERIGVLSLIAHPRCAREPAIVIRPRFSRPNTARMASAASTGTFHIGCLI
jgi:hypothetical protein